MKLLGVLLLTVAGCELLPAAPSPSTTVTTAPPASAPVNLEPGVDVSYTLTLVRDPFPYVSVTLVTKGTDVGVTRVGLDEWGGVEHPEADVRGLAAFDSDGRALFVEPEPSRHATWRIHHPGRALLRIHYSLVPTEGEVSTRARAHFRPLLQPTFFHAIGHTALLDLRDVSPTKRLHVALHWQGWKEAGWTPATSLGVDPEGFSVTTTMRELRHAVFLAGDIRLVRRDIGPTRSPLWVAVAGKDWGFTDAEIGDTAAAVVTAQRSFFQDFDWPFFLITVIPLGAHEGKGYLAGTGLTHSFATFLGPKTGLKTLPDGTGVPWLLSHELFHLWNGGRYELKEPEALGYWFSEGFTNFYARRLLLRAGLMDRDGFVMNLNDEVRRYYLSPAVREPAARSVDFWKSNDIHDIVYRRGDVIALMVDAEIRKVSNGAMSLDNLMRDFLGRPTDPKPLVTPESLLETIGAYTSPAFANRIRETAVDGKVLDLDPKLLEPCLVAHTEPIGPYELGFDDKAAFEGHIDGVVKGSNAYKAGLRDGQHRVSWSFSRGDPMQQVEVTIDEGGTNRTITFLPQGKPLPVVQFTVSKDGDSCSGLL